MKKFLVGIISLSLLLSACTPREIALAERCRASTVLLHMKISLVDPKTQKELHGLGTCSGVYVTPNLILTADHCVDMSIEGGGLKLNGIFVRNTDDEHGTATIVKTDPMKDLALIRTNLKGVPVKLARDVRVGQTIWIVGNPLGIEFVVSKGIVSATDLKFGDFPINHFVTDAVVLPGNSGGPAFNSRGQLVGIVVMSTSFLGIFGASGLGVVVQTNEVRDFLKHVK